MRLYLRNILSIFLTTFCLGCSRPVPIPGLLSYFTFADKNRMARLKEYDLIGERVDPNDSTKVLYSQKLTNRFFVELHSSRTYTLLFQPSSDVLFPVGINKVSRVRFRYDGLPGVVDWLEFTNNAEEWINPTNVKFNGKPIPRRDSNEPVERSFLYVLE